MTSPLIVNAEHPRKDVTSITQAGIKAYDLVLTHKAILEPRLPAGMIEGLRADLDTLGVTVSGALQARHEAHAATASQNALLDQGHSRVTDIRKTLRKAGAPKDVQRAYGVGQRTNRNRVHHVKAALSQIIDRATAAPDEAAGFGLIAADVAALKLVHDSISDADSTQETKRALAPLSTKKRNMTANRVLQAAVRIAGAGLIAFPNAPKELADFKALMASTNHSQGASEKKPEGQEN